MHALFRNDFIFAHGLFHFALLLFGRHWIVGLTNIGLTTLLGLGLVRGAECWRFLKIQPHFGLLLRYGVLIAALFKGAFYLVLGVSLQGPPNFRWIAGFFCFIA